uniref:YtkA-like domain-containing protein n=1 Tax=Chlorobium chlorochromatii (strain CaD3) TaxID=340177 RepID=Q3AQU9_CHLCH
MVFQRSMKVFTTFALFAGMMMASSNLHAVTVDDSIHEKACSVVAGERTVTLSIDPKPVKHMKELTFTVSVTPCDKLPDMLLLDLSMPGMQMGKNQVTLKKISSCKWQGNGIIVRCMSGRKLWQATVLSNELNNPAFAFNVRD